MAEPIDDYWAFQRNKDSVPVEPTTTAKLEEFVGRAFPNRRQFKVNWLRLESDIRRALTLESDYENRLIVIDILLGEHTQRGTELATR